MSFRRVDAVVALTLCASAAALAWAGLIGWVWSDYELEVHGPLQALLGGDFATFTATAPGYGGSLLMRAPFAFVADALGGGDLAVYRALAVPCLAAGVVLGQVLWTQRRRRLPDEAKGWAVVIALLAAANPLTLHALDVGHPEELLGGALCAGAVLAALGGRPALAGALLGLAVANKAWAVLAAGPVLVALPSRRQAAVAVAVAAAVGGALMAPFLLADHGRAGVAAGAGRTGTIFQPWQAWWFLADHAGAVIGTDGQPKLGYRAAPAWIGPITHPLIALTVIPATALFWLRRRGAGARGREDALLLLAVLLLSRCFLDVWNIGYYHLPFLLALLCWEARASERPPVLTLAAAALVWLSFNRAPAMLSPDGQSLLYMAWVAPLWLTLAARALRRPAPARAVTAAAAAARRRTVPSRPVRGA